MLRQQHAGGAIGRHETSHALAETPLEVWGGVEATLNRIGDQYHDQLERTGHLHRLEDLDLFADLGIKAIRYPVLWENVAPKSLDSPDWRWTDERLGYLRERGIRPIAGLLHHGSGPAYTNLLDPDFPQHLAEYALAVARRYPWLEDYTPVNEPLTTARFSALYGHWYPHASDGPSFARALVNQCRATVLAMQAIRSVNPDARLIQTEDIARVHSTPHMAYQADYENERRWASLDLLTGRLDEGDPMFEWLVAAGIPREDLVCFRTDPCAPDVMAVNYYLTSERYLDERVDHYPDETPGNNGLDTYVDVSALHALPGGIGGFRSALEDVWTRYHLPVAVGEVHLGDRPEEQLRWLNDAWIGVEELRSEGVDVRAVTVWALLGSFDWRSLVTRVEGHYEPGAFDVRGPAPRRTALARMISDLTRSGHFRHPLLELPGWWNRSERLYPHHTPDSNLPVQVPESSTNPLSYVLVVGDESPLQRALLWECGLRHIPARHVEPKDLPEALRAIQEHEAWAVILTDGGVPGVPGNPSLRVDRSALVRALANAAARTRAALIIYSNPHVFDGEALVPYPESACTMPPAMGLRTIADIERLARSLHPDCLICRVGHLFGPGTNGILDHHSSGDEIVSPAYLPDVANATLDLLIDGEAGIWHLAAGPPIANSGFRAMLREALALPDSMDHTGHRDGRMRALASERGVVMPAWESAIDHYVHQHRDAILSSLGT